MYRDKGLRFDLSMDIFLKNLYLGIDTYAYVLISETGLMLTIQCYDGQIKYNIAARKSAIPG